MKKQSVFILAGCMMALPFVIAPFTPAIGKEKAKKPAGEVVMVSQQSTFEMRKAFDPHTAFGATSTTLNSMVFDGLVVKDAATGAFQPSLAESWNIAKDWSSISFKLRKGVKFHNGDPLTAKDVKFSIERMMREDMKNSIGFDLRKNISKVEIVDDFNVNVLLKEPNPAFFATFLERCFEFLAIVPKDYVEKVGDDGFAAKPIGAGPFRILKFERDVSFDVEAVENHHRKTPDVKTLRYKFVPEHSTRLAMLKTGEADFIALYLTHIPLLLKDPDIKIVWSRDTYCVTLVFHDLAHPEDSPFKNPLVRKATSLAIDRKGIADVIGNGTMEPWGSFLAPYHLGFDTKRNKPDPYNPAEAKKLLTQAGYPNGFDTVLTYTSTQKERFEAIAQQLRDVGIRCKMDMLEGGTWSASFVAGRLRGIGFGSGPWWSGRSHPAGALQSHITGIWSHKLATPAIIKAMEDTERAIGNKEIAAAAKKLDETIIEANIRLPLWSIHVPFAMRKTIESYTPMPGFIFPMGFESLKLRGK
ncbi:MAG: peptide/nickel transport system substrate-binding protein [Syntrophaceae bacterium]|nr:MAG: peptide/nickel transport system substrate-binding protein [Syntrophaceae bacterium]